jgi:hypothetical protein
MNLYFAEIVPHVYWTYYDSSITYQPQHKNYITQLCNRYHIKHLIKVDSLYKKLPSPQLLYSTMCSDIIHNYRNAIPTLIISIYYNDIALGGIVHFFSKMVPTMSHATIIDNLKYKIINCPEVPSTFIMQ